MSFSLFFHKFENIAAKETRAFNIPKGHKLLPPGEYGLLELYCDTPGCDCRRVIFWVTRSDHPDRALATVNFGWESKKFYTKWMGSSDGVDEMVGASLEPMGAQSKHSEALLALCQYALQDSAYLERIKRHYQMFRDSVEAKLAMKNETLEPSDKIRICLTNKEWELILEETFIDDDLTASVITDGNKKYIDWSADDIDCAIGYIAEAANHVENKQTAKRLDKLLDKIEKFETKLPSKIVPLDMSKTDEYVPDWAKADAKLRTTPCSDEELDTLTQGTIGSIDDLDAWKNLVAMVGLEDATQTIRMALIEGQGLNIKKLGH